MMPKRGKKIEEETEVVEIEATEETEAIQADPSLIVRLYLHQLHLSRHSTSQPFYLSCKLSWRQARKIFQEIRPEANDDQDCRNFSGQRRKWRTISWLQHSSILEE
nr:hypothetical protein Itr_chr04CG16840 [Ipomoea trifida]